MTATDFVLTDDQRRLATALKIKGLDDVLSFPKMAYWNYNACAHHQDVGPQIDCAWRACGGDLFSHQRVGTTWLLAVKNGLLADDPGVGKTLQILALMAILKEKNELRRRAIIVPNTPAVGQWGDEIARWVPGLRSTVIDSSLLADKRINKYSTPWDVLVIGYHLLIKDVDTLVGLGPYDLVVSDDVDPLLKHSNATHEALRKLSQGSKFAFTLNATPLQIELEQLHGALVPVGGYDIFDSLEMFKLRYRKREKVFDETTGKKKWADTGYKNVTEFKEKIRPILLRRKATELTDIRMPDLMPPQIEWLEMSSLQRTRYEELQAGIMRLIREEGETIKHINALAKFTYGQQICAGLPALGEPDGPGASPKMDRLFHRLNGVWSDRKSIVFVKNVGMVKAAIHRSAESGFGCAMVWGQKQNAKQRKEQVERFWDDPDCRILIGTTSLERSLNLQVANNVVALDTHLNPARMKQILGRARRAGSAHDRVFFTSYMMLGTQEEKYNDALRRRQAMSDVALDDQSELYEALPPLQLLQLMTP